MSASKLDSKLNSKSNSKFATIALVSSAMLAAFASVDVQAKGAPATTATYGSTAPADSAERQIVLTPSTKYVNVTNGETVTFVENGKTFTWDFSTYDHVNLKLSAIAPKGLGYPDVRVYVDRDPSTEG